MIMRQGWIAVAAATMLIGGAFAQSPAPAPLPNLKPEVQLLIAPGPTGWMVATVYPGKVARAQTQARLRRLRLMTGWPVEGLTFEDRQLDSQTAAAANPAQSAAARPVMSSALFQTTGNLADFSQGTLALEPFLVAFQDFSRIHVTYLGLTKFSYQGLRRYADPRVEIELQAQDGAYTFAVQLKERPFESLNLPARDIPQQEKGTAAANTSAQSRRLWLRIGVVALIALGVAGLAYALAQRLLQRP